MTAIGPGSVVVCVDASNLPDFASLIMGARYGVERVIPRGLCIRDGMRGPGLRLRGRQLPYDIRRFRPVDDGDAAIFHQMIEPIKHKVPA